MRVRAAVVMVMISLFMAACSNAKQYVGLWSLSEPHSGYLLDNNDWVLGNITLETLALKDNGSGEYRTEGLIKNEGESGAHKSAVSYPCTWTVEGDRIAINVGSYRMWASPSPDHNHLLVQDKSAVLRTFKKMVAAQ